MDEQVKGEESIKTYDMSEDMIKYSVSTARSAMSKYVIEKDIAGYIKRDFDNKFGANWHCIVGKQFGSYVSHESKHYIYFYIGELSFLLFKFG